jgi:ankyrin repeat protein
MVLAGWGFARLLLDRIVADPSLANFASDGRTLLHVAAEAGQRTTALLLVQLGADRAAPDPSGRTAAELAAAAGHAALAESLRP